MVKHHLARVAHLFRFAFSRRLGDMTKTVAAQVEALEKLGGGRAAGLSCMTSNIDEGSDGNWGVKSSVAAGLIQ